MDGVSFAFVIIFVIFYVCCKVCCSDESDEESTGQTAASPQNQNSYAQNYGLTAGSTSNTQSYYNDNHIGFAISPTQPNLPYPSLTTGSTYSPQVPFTTQPVSNLSGQFDSPPSYDEAMKHLSQQQNLHVNNR